MNDDCRVDKDDIEWCWECTRWDGMLSAIAFYKENPVYINCVSYPQDLKDPRIYAVYHITPEEYTKTAYRNVLWKNFVGFHQELTIKRQRMLGQWIHPEPEHKKYPYWGDPIKYDLSNLIGYMTLDNSEIDHRRISILEKKD